MDTLLNLKNNLIQNFYILGFNPDKFFYKGSDGKWLFHKIIKEPKLIMTPEVISKFPPNNGNYNSITDEIVLAHCFPKDLHVLQVGETKKSHIYFEFNLDNFLFNSTEEEKNLYSKIYFTCLEFYEPLELYNNYKKEILSLVEEKNSKIEIVKDGVNEVLQPSSSTYLQKFYIPKIICFASVLPFHTELETVLNLIYQLYSIKPKDSSIMPIEKLIEQIVIQTPIPMTIHTQVDLTFKINMHGIDLMSRERAKEISKQKYKTSANLLTPALSAMRLGAIPPVNNPMEHKIHFPLFNINQAYIRFYNTFSLEECFSFFSIDDIIRIYKNILLEVPILFFCSEKRYLSIFIENLLGLLSPFNYVLPNVTILPKRFYGFINSEAKFIFGINEVYNPNFFENNKIDIDKNIVIVSLNVENRTMSKIEEKMKAKDTEENNYIIVNYNYDKKNENDMKNSITNDYVIYDKYKTDLINIELPKTFKSKLANNISNILINSKKRQKKNIDENVNHQIKHEFFKFIVGILNGYSDYFLKSKYFYKSLKTKNCGDNIRYKSLSDNISDVNFLKELFNIDDFLTKSSRESPAFYYVFFHTKIFLNYLRDRIYFGNRINSFPYYQFDQMIYLKKHTEGRKKVKGLYENFKSGNIEKPKVTKVIDIIIKPTNSFNQLEFARIIDPNKKIELLIKYGQLLHSFDEKNNQLKINYCIFPKLLYDDEFFEAKYENSYFLNGIELPSDKILQEYKDECLTKSTKYFKEVNYMLYPNITDNLKFTSKADFNVEVYEYVQYNWLILLCSSLWYCEPTEREIRLNKIFDILDKISYIEEKVLIFIYFNFLKYGNKSQCITLFEKMAKFTQHTNYLLLSLLCLKVEEDDKKSIKTNTDNNFIQNENNEKKYVLKKRSIILNNETFFKNRYDTQKGTTLKLGVIMEDSRINFTKKLPQNKDPKPKIVEKKEQPQQKIKTFSHKEKIIFNQGQFCQKCKKITFFDTSEIMELNIEAVRVNFGYKCKNCGEVNNTITINYQILLINENKNQVFITKVGQFKLLSPFRLYSNLTLDLLTRRDYSLKIDNIYNEQGNELFNYIFYFCRKNLTFDFLIPYKTLNDIDLEFFETNLGTIIDNINKKKFSDKEKMTYENLIKERNNEFIPIDISNVRDLTPCYTCGNKEGNDKNKDNNKGTHFSIIKTNN